MFTTVSRHKYILLQSLPPSVVFSKVDKFTGNMINARNLGIMANSQAKQIIKNIKHNLKFTKADDSYISKEVRVDIINVEGVKGFSDSNSNNLFLSTLVLMHGGLMYALLSVCLSVT